MKPIRIKASRDLTSVAYLIGNIAFSIVSTPANGLRQCFKLLTCRDYVHEAVRASVHNDTRLSHHHDPESDPPVNMNKLRLLVVNGKPGIDYKTFTRGISDVVKTLNFYGSVAGFKGKVFALPADVEKVYSKAYLLVGPKEWISSPYLLSMVTLLVRISVVFGPIDFEDNDALEQKYEDILSEYGNEYIANADEDAYGFIDRMMGPPDMQYLKICRKKFHLLMKNHERLFVNPISMAYPPPMPFFRHEFHSRGGITSLCSFGSYDVTIGRRFREIVFRKREEEFRHECRRIYYRYGT